MFAKLTATSVVLATLASAQTFTACDPTKKACPADPALGAEVKTIDFRKGATDFFHIADGTKLTYDANDGALFTIASEGQAPTITSSKYIFFGKVDVVLKASAGVGVVTSVTLQSDDLDEIDWEWLGGDSTQVQTNYFSKGCTEVYDRGGYSPVSNPQSGFNTYTIDWTPQSVKWIINGAVVRELVATNAKGCDGFPQTPMQVKLGTWVAGRKDAPQGTIDWAGGLTDYSKGPFVGYYQSVTIQDYMGGQGATSAGEYSYGDFSGTYQSIKISGSSGSTNNTESSTSTTASSTASSTAKSTTLTTVTSSGASTTTTAASTTHSGASNSTASTTTTSAATSSSSAPATTTPNGAGKVAGSLVMAGAGILGALFL
jgi:beta-glucanase (GH16 family)